MNMKRFLEKGYDIIPAENKSKLFELKEKIFQKSKQLVEYQNEDMDEFFNKFHKYGLKGSALNEKRLEIIKYCTENLNVGKTVFEAFEKSITEFVGPDIVTQKTTNLVIQQPNDPDATGTHRDSPLNSPFEIVVWLPLVDVYGTKSMYIVEHKKVNEALELLKNSDSGFRDFSEFASNEGENLEVPFGSAVFFWPGLVHGIHVNKEDETRWTLNMRYKSIFSPCGSKGLVEFFDLLRLSPLSQMAFEYEKEAYINEELLLVH